MCSRTTCRKCGKPTWSGCGNHVEQALKGVAKKDRCQGHANDPVEPGFFAKLFGGKKQFLFIFKLKPTSFVDSLQEILSLYMLWVFKNLFGATTFENQP